MAENMPAKPVTIVTDRKPTYHVGNNLDERLAKAFGRLGGMDQGLGVTLAERRAGLVEGRITRGGPTGRAPPGPSRAQPA